MWIINLIGIAFILFIVWWFWIASGKRAVSADRVIQIIVDNGIYTPAKIQVEQGQALVLQFIRNDPSPCAGLVIFDKLNLSANLLVGEKVDLVIPTETKGQFEFTCQMQMYKGLLEIK